MLQTADPILAEITKRLIAQFHPENIYLFGSRARGTPHADSDYDLMVIVSHSNDPGYKRAQKAHRCMTGIPAAIDIFVFTHDEFARSRGVVGSLPDTILTEGKSLYAA